MLVIVKPLNHNFFFCMIQIIINIIISNQIDSPHTQVEIKVDCTRMDEIKFIHLWMTWSKSTCQSTTQIKFTCLWVTKIKSNSSSMVKKSTFFFCIRRCQSRVIFPCSLFITLIINERKPLTNVLQLYSQPHLYI
jgi:hypothetical protein